MAARNSIDTKQDPSAIIAVRVFNAPRDLVFEAFTDPRHLMHWWGPNGFTLTTHTCDVRAGGVWRFVMPGPDGRDYQDRITYEEIVSTERLVYRHGGGDDVEPVKFQVTVTFEDIGGKTRLTMRMQFPSEDERNRVIAEMAPTKASCRRSDNSNNIWRPTWNARSFSSANSMRRDASCSRHGRSKASRELVGIYKISRLRSAKWT